MQGPFASAAKLLAAFQSGQLDVCSLPAPHSSSPSATSWASTVPFKAPQAGVNSTDAPPAVTNGGLQSQVQPRQGLLSLLSYTLQHPMSFIASSTIFGLVMTSCTEADVAIQAEE